MTVAKLLIFVCAFCVMSEQVLAGEASICTPKGSVQVESSVSNLRDWQAVYASFRANKACNAEAVVEVWTAYSQVVAGLFANHWDKSNDFFRLASEHADFKNFVVKHLADEAIPEDVLQAIRVHAQSSCSSGFEAMCKEIDGATR